jgi:para-aminobenzoate synthetase component 1
LGASFRFRPRVLELGGEVEPADALARLEAHALPVLLDSARGEPRRSSVFGFDPLPPRPDPAHGVLAPRELLRELRDEGGDAVPGPFHGGFLGALGYDLGARGERPVRAEPEPFGLPALVGALYVDFLVRDEALGRTFLVLGDDPGDGREPLERRRARILAELATPAGPRELRAGELVRHVSSAEHRARIERCRELIARGDLYQANLAHRFTCDVDGPPHAWYARLRAANPAPYMGYAAWNERDGFAGAAGALLSASPELLVELDGSVARTRPIKGTIARSPDEREDARRRAELLASVKDLAELAMIVDLERNDLGRIARAGGVRVERFPRLESYARVHHLMADVVADVQPGKDIGDVLAALFPGGSITGAPKLRAMEVIAELEREARGFFCGSLGFADLRGRAAFNILIRTLTWRPRRERGPGSGELSFRVGGGITWSSDAAAEERETLDKAAGALEALFGGELGGRERLGDGPSVRGEGKE